MIWYLVLFLIAFAVASFFLRRQIFSLFGIGMEGRRLREYTYKYTHANKAFPYRLYDPAERKYMLEYEDGSTAVGAIFEISPAIVAVDDSAFDALFDTLIPGATLQFILYGSPNITKRLDAFKKQAVMSKENPLFKDIIDEYAGFFERATKEGVNKMMPTTLKDYRMFVSILLEKNHDNISYIAESVENILNTKGFEPEAVKPDNLVGTLYEYFNMNHDFRDIPKYDDSQIISNQILAPDTLLDGSDSKFVESDGTYYASLNPIELPMRTSLWHFCTRLGDYLSENKDKQQFNSPFIVSTAVSSVPESEVAKIKVNIQSIHSQELPENLFPRLAKKKADATIATKSFEEKKKLVKMSLNVIVTGNSKKNLKSNIDAVKMYWASGSAEQRIKLKEDKFINTVNVLSAVPLGVNYDYYELTEKYRTIFAEQASCFIPVESDWKGTPNPVVPLITRRGQFMAFDLFDSPSNYNGYIVATSGAGKSVFINDLTLMYLAKGDNVFIFDVGRSYEKLAKTIGGQWIEFDAKNPMSLNPFSEIKTKEDFDDGWEYLRDFIYMIGGSLSKEEAKKGEKLIKSYIDASLQEMWNEYKDELEISHISQWFLTAGHREGKKELIDFGQQLKPFTRDGIYGRFFSGPSSVDFHKQFVVMELDSIIGNLELRDAVMMVMTYHISRKVYLSKIAEHRTILIFDEQHRFLRTSPRVDLFTKNAYRQIRKHDGAIFGATQGFNDIYSPNDTDPDSAGNTILNTSAWKFFLKQNEESINALKSSNLFSFSDMDYHLLRSIDNYKPFHSEVFMVTPWGIKVPARIVTDKFMYYLFTTYMPDKIRINRYVEQGDSISTAIKKVIEDDKRNVA